LQLLQRSFVAEFLASKGDWEVVSGAKVPTDKHLDWYLSSGALQWHMQCAWTRPLVNDGLACSWLSRSQEQVLECAVEAIPIEAQVELASDLAKTGKLENAVRILHNAIQRRQMPLLELQSNARLLFSYVDRIPVGDSSDAVAAYDAQISFKMYGRSDKASADGEFAFGRLLASLDRGASLGHLAMFVWGGLLRCVRLTCLSACSAGILLYKGFNLKGFLPSHPSPSKSEFYEGGQLVRRAANEVSSQCFYCLWQYLESRFGKFEAAVLLDEISNPLESYARKWQGLWAFTIFAGDYW
jgi:hypothetical protein